MDKLYNFLRIVFFTAIFALLKYFHCLLFINNIFVFKILELAMFFILSFGFVYLTDYTKSRMNEKLEICLYCASIFTAICFILSLLKTIFQTNQILIVAINFAEFGLLGALPFIRDNYFHTKIHSRTLIVDYAYIAAFVFLKLMFNLLSLLMRNSDNADAMNIVFIMVFSFVIFMLRPIIFSILIKGFIDFDGNEYPVFNKFKVGRTKDSDIFIDDAGEEKTVFTVMTKNKWMIIPSVELDIENRSVMSKYEVEDSQTVKYKNNYFTITHGKGNILKRFFIVFIFILTVAGLNAKSGDLSFSKKNDIIIENVDYMNYPLINVYMTINYGTENTGYYDKEKFLAIDSDRIGMIKTIESNESPVDIVFIIDVTGSMFDTYYMLKDNFRKFVGDIRYKRKSVRTGVITFTDNIGEIKVYELTSDTEKIMSRLNSIVPDTKEFNSDFKENPYDAIFKLKDMNFDGNAQKVVILITDAPPHIKGDRADHGRDFTSKTTEDVRQFLNSSSYLFYVVSFERYQEYKTVINSNPYKLYDLEFEDFSSIFLKLENVIKNQVKLTYLTTRGKDQFERGITQKIQIFKDEDALKAKKNFDAINIKKTAFFESIFDTF